MDIVIVTSAKNDEEALEFLVQMGLPLQKERTDANEAPSLQLLTGGDK